jgi:hypothetical protein
MKNKIVDLIAKIEFWYAKNFIKVDKHYTFFVDLNGAPGSFAIKYLKKYTGVIVEFNNVKITDESGLTFDYDIIANVNNCNVKSKGFIRFTQNVMRSILHSAIENAIRDKDENRNADFVESGEEREVYEEVASVPEERVPERKPRKKAVRRNKAIHPEV